MVNLFGEEIKEEQRFTDADVESIWKAYPDCRGKQPALKQIRNALQRLAKMPKGPADPVAALLKRTQEFAEVREDQKKAFTPMASTWFGQSRYAEIKSSWYDRDDPRYGVDDE